MTALGTAELRGQRRPRRLALLALAAAGALIAGILSTDAASSTPAHHPGPPP